MTVSRRANGTFQKNTHWRDPKPHWEKDWLFNEYIVKMKSTGEIALAISTSDANVLYWLKKHNIQRRSISSARAIKHWGASGQDNPMFGKTGVLNPRYIDGSSPERQRLYAQGFGKDFKRLVLKRDKYKCRRCGKGKTHPKSLHVHHIISWAGNVELRFDLNNVVVLCKTCHHWVHSKSNYNRDFLA